MKRKMKKKIAVCGLLMFGALIGCENDGVTETEEVLEVQNATITETEIQLVDEADLISEEVNNIVEDIYTAEEVSLFFKVPFNSNFLPECVTITTEVTATTREKTIAFGESCELPNGNIVSGTIFLSFEKDMELLQKTLNFSLENFVFNGVGVAGSSSIVRTRANENENPQSVVTADFIATWPDETSASISGTRTREWIEGFDTPVWGDNVFLISGNRTFTNRNGFTYQKNISTPLRRELACRFIVSGIVDISRGDATATLDFGDGNCDNVGTLTNGEGESMEINLRRFK
ncbi:hypothetical protein [Spongiimicrobium salis]|uniref:hypothetical protein n=1 Tax=Spongiimicrobium salis TaxID=1667022 RepID=UPI00374CD71E